LTQITRLPDAEAVAAHAAEVVAGVVNATTEPVHVALAGGTTPERCHELLAPLVTSWRHVHLWLSDERAVAPDDDDSNFKMVKRSLLDRIEIPAENVHRVLGELGADEAADRYEAEIRAVVGAGPGGVPAIDVIMAGMGPDGHTLSLFPGHPEVEIRDRLVVGLHDSPKPPPDRITFTLALVAAAPRTLLLIAGEGKRDAAARVLAGPDPATPASMLAIGNLEVVVDAAAAPS
jgi:6-phosphogluconolactonase